MRDEGTKPDTDFAPNLKNTVVFIYSWVMSTTTFFVNYEGRPFMESITSNQKLKKAILVLYAIAGLMIMDLEMTREYFELVPFPGEEFQMRVGLILALDTGLCWLVATMVKRVYAKSFEVKED